MPAPKSLTNALREEYETLFSTMTMRAHRLAEIERIWRKIETHAGDYKKIEKATSVPWFVVAIIHNLEASLRFDGHLHNGDSLDAHTTRVPRGRPESGQPPFAWTDSAIDALRYKKLDRWDDWSLSGIAFILERYNGWGYRSNHPQVKSPYLWSFTDVYFSGKYVADRKFSTEAVSQQCGGLALLKYMMDRDKTIARRVNWSRTEAEEDDSAPFPALDPAASQDGGADTAPSPLRKKAPRFPGVYLLEGTISDSVKLAQQKLKTFGCDPGDIDGEFGEITKLATMLFQARSTNPAGEPLEIDGVIGPETWAALFGPDGSVADTPVDPTDPTPTPKLAELVLEIASDEVGVKEIPLGSNRGKRVEAYLDSVKLGGGNPWCMAFIYWCYEQAAKRLGVANLPPKTGHVRTAWNESKDIAGATVITAREAQADPSRIKPGMIFFMAFDQSRGHAGLVVANLNGRLETIEGNTNDDGHREGNGVFRRTRRKITDVNLGFAGYA